MSFKSFLLGAGKDLISNAPAIESFLAPALGPYGAALMPIVNLAGSAILSAHSAPLTNEEKKSQVMNTLEATAPAISAILQKQGITVSDPEKFAKGTSALVDSLVSVMKGMGALPPVAAVSPTSVPISGSMVDKGDGSIELTISWKLAEETPQSIADKVNA